MSDTKRIGKGDEYTILEKKVSSEDGRMKYVINARVFNLRTIGYTLATLAFVVYFAVAGTDKLQMLISEVMQYLKNAGGHTRWVY